MRFLRHFQLRHAKHPSLLFLWRIIQAGGRNLWRNKTLSIATTLIIGLMFFVFNVILAVNLAADSVLTNVGKKIDLRVELRSEAEDYSKRNLVNDLKGLPEVGDVFYISGEEALGRLGSKYPNILTFLEQNHLKNPLPDVIRVVAQKIEDNPKIIDFLSQPRYATVVNQDKLRSDPEEIGRQQKIIAISQFLKQSGIFLNLVFALVATLILFNTIRLNVYAHEKEITIMQLVGARFRFIRGGYLFEGICYAIAALVLSLILSRFAVMYLAKNLIGVIADDNFLMGLNAILLHFGDLFWLTLLWEFFAAVGVGLLSSFLAIELYLNKKSYL